MRRGRLVVAYTDYMDYETADAFLGGINRELYEVKKRLDEAMKQLKEDQYGGWSEKRTEMIKALRYIKLALDEAYRQSSEKWDEVTTEILER